MSEQIPLQYTETGDKTKVPGVHTTPGTLFQVLVLVRLSLIARVDGSGRTNVGTSAAVYTNIRIDGVDVALADSASGAFVDTSTTSDAVAADYVCHVVQILEIVSNVLVLW